MTLFGKSIMQGNRNIQIEGLRGIAILMVVVYHIFCRYQQIYLSETIEWMERFGAYAVNLFFLMSGYFLGQRTNFVKKIIRLWPSYVVGVLLSVVLLAFFPLPNKEINFIQVLTNVFFINGFIKIPYVDGAHWYVHTLIIMFFWGILIRHRNFIFLIAWIVGAVVAECADVRIISHFLGGKYVGCFVCGMALRNFLDEPGKRWLGVLAFAVAGVFVGQSILFGTIFIVSLFVLYLCIKGKLKLLGTKILCFLGLISYPLYVVHQNLAYVVLHYLTPMIGFAWATLVSFFVCISMGAVLFWLVENNVHVLLRVCKKND